MLSRLLCVLPAIEHVCFYPESQASSVDLGFVMIAPVADAVVACHRFGRVLSLSTTFPIYHCLPPLTIDPFVQHSPQGVKTNVLFFTRGKKAEKKAIAMKRVNYRSLLP